MKVIIGTPPELKNSPEKSSGRLSAQSSAVGFQTFPSNFSTLEHLEWEKISMEELIGIASTNSLMGDVGMYRFSGALTGPRSEEFLNVAKELHSSPHQFIFTEEKLLKKVVDKLQKVGADVVVYPPKDTASKKVEAFNIFSLTYAFAARDRKKLWILYREALSRGVVPEAIAGILHWKVRDLLVKGERSGFSKQELRSVSGELVSLYHDSHRGVGELPVLLERYILQL